MKHVYPVRHPASLDNAPNGGSTATREPALPHEHDESSHSQAGTTQQQKAVGQKAYGNATDGTADTDRGAVVDQVYNEKLAPDRGSTAPRR